VTNLGHQVSPVDHFFVAVHETATEPGTLAAGPAASVAAIPAGYEYTTALVPGRGINATMYGLGDMLLAKSGKKRPDPYGQFSNFDIDIDIRFSRFPSFGEGGLGGYSIAQSFR